MVTIEELTEERLELAFNDAFTRSVAEELLVANNISVTEEQLTHLLEVCKGNPWDVIGYVVVIK